MMHWVADGCYNGCFWKEEELSSEAEPDTSVCTSDEVGCIFGREDCHFEEINNSQDLSLESRQCLDLKKCLNYLKFSIYSRGQHHQVIYPILTNLTAQQPFSMRHIHSCQVWLQPLIS